MKNSKTLLAVMAAVSIVSFASAQNMLQDPGFENGLTGWTAFGNALQITYNATSNNGPAPYAGTGELKEYGPFNGQDYAASGVFQSFSASAGQQFVGSGFMQNWSGDPMQGGNFAILQVAFYNTGGTQLSYFNSTAEIDATTATNAWDSMSTGTVTAPANTSKVQFFVLFLQHPANTGGSAWADNVSMQAVPLPSASIVFGIATLGLLIRRRNS